MKKILLSFFAVLFLPSVIAASSTSWSPKAFEVGENYIYKLKWVGIPVGHVKVEVSSLKEWKGREVYVVEIEAKTNRFASVFYRIRDHFVSYIDKERLIPLRLEVSRREGTYKQDALTHFDHERGVAYFENFLDGSKKQYRISSEVQDIISLFYLIRHQKIELHSRQFYDLTFAEEVFHVEGKIEKKERIKLPDGTVKEAFFAEPVARRQNGELFKDGTGTCYFSDDAYQVPLFLTLKAPIFTSITAVLSESSVY